MKKYCSSGCPGRWQQQEGNVVRVSTTLLSTSAFYRAVFSNQSLSLSLLSNVRLSPLNLFFSFNIDVLTWRQGPVAT